MAEIKKKYAFISYNHLDVLWAIRLKLKMIWFKLPSYIENEFKKSKYLEPVFRDRDYLTSGNLPTMIKRQLDNCRYLIVICSPHSAKSKWVNQEVDYFLNKKKRSDKESDPADYIVPYILLDEPIDKTDCYPPALLEFERKRKEKDPAFDLLYITKNDDEEKLFHTSFSRIIPFQVRTEKSFARVIAKVLGITDEFDDIWRLHQRLLKRRWKIRAVIATVIVAIIAFLLYPMSISIKINDDQHFLPESEDAILYVNNIGYPLSKIDTTIKIKDLPWYFLFKDIPIRFSATYYTSKDTSINTSFSHNGLFSIEVKRDSTFGIYAGTVKALDGKTVSDVIVTISPQKGVAGKSCKTDKNGHFHIYYPTKEQRETMYCSVTKDGKICYERYDEVPYDSLILPLKP